VRKAIIAFVLSMWAGLAGAQTLSIDFDAIAPGTTAEALGVAGVTFTAAPAGSWVVQPSALATLTGNLLIVPVGASVLTADFAVPYRSYSFLFATNGAATVQVEGFLGGTPVFTSTFTGSIPPGVAFPEGTAAGAGPAFDRLVIQTLGGQEIAIDNFAAAGLAQVPTLSEWGLILLAGLMGIAAFATLRRRG